MAEWSNAPVLKTGDVKASVGSNPTLSAKALYMVLQKYPRGRRGSPAKGVVREERSQGSNPCFSAKLYPTEPVKVRLGAFLQLWVQISLRHRVGFEPTNSFFHHFTGSNLITRLSEIRTRCHKLTHFYLPFVVVIVA